jgi:hypothetical protein
MLKENEVNIGIEPFDNFDADNDLEENEMGEVHENDEVDPKLDEIGEDVSNASQPKGKVIRSQTTWSWRTSIWLAHGGRCHSMW